MIDVSIIIVNYNLTESVRELLLSIEEFVKGVKFKTYVVDNNSPDQSIKKLETDFPETEFIYLDQNYGFGIANNYVMKKSKSKYILLLNPDTRLVNDAVTQLVNFAEEKKQFGILSCETFDSNNRVHENALDFPNYSKEFFNIFGLVRHWIEFKKIIRHKVFNEEYYEADTVGGSCMLIRSSIFDEIDMFDEDYFLFAEETDLCYRLKKFTKYKVGYNRTIRLFHYGGQVTNKNVFFRIKIQNESKLIFFKKNYSFIKTFILRWFKIFSFGVEILKTLIRFEFKSEKLLLYFYLVKYFFLAKPKTNKLRIQHWKGE